MDKLNTFRILGINPDFKPLQGQISLECSSFVVHSARFDFVEGAQGFKDKA